MNEIQIILQINPFSEYAYQAFCRRAMIHGPTHADYLENMKNDLDSALRLKEIGFAGGYEYMVDRVAATYETIMRALRHSGAVEVGQTTCVQEYLETIARKRAISNDRIPYQPIWSNEMNFASVFEFSSGMGFDVSEFTLIPVLCSHRKKIDAMVHFAVDEQQKDQVLPRLSSTELSRNAILWAADAIKSPLLLFALQHPQMSLKEFDLNSLLIPQEDTSLLFPEEGLIVAYHLIFDCEICSDSLIRWVIKNGTIVHCDRKEIVKDELVQCIDYFPSLFDRFGTLLNIQSVRFSQQNDVCRYLYHVLLGGIDERLLANDTHHITFVPDRELFRVPFACLLDGNGKYLIEKYSFSVSNSLRMIGENGKQKESVVLSSSSSCSVLVCGDATIAGQTDAARSGLRVDDAVRSFEALSVSPSIVVLSRGQFVPMIFRACCSELHPRIVHVVSHGSRSNDDDLTSSDDILDQFRLSGSLACSNGTELTAQTVAETCDLHGTDLVFLNACHLASGHTQANGILGFTRAIFRAGCPSVVSALWNVYPSISNALSRAFYESYFSGFYDKSESLRIAILRSIFPVAVEIEDTRLPRIRDYPVFWAPFQVFGNRF